MYVSVQQLRLAILAIGALAALVLVLDLAQIDRSTPRSPATKAYTGIPRQTPGSTAHLRLAYRAQLAARNGSA
jgi:hypothetical protein